MEWEMMPQCIPLFILGLYYVRTKIRAAEEL